MVTTIGLVLASVAGCQDESRLSEQDARDVASRAEGPVFYVGTEFAGLPLTRAKTGPEGSPVDAYFVYGDCEPSGDEPRCTPPLQIQSAVCANGGTRVGIFVSHGFPRGQGQLRALVWSLRSAGDGEAPAPEEIRFDLGPSC